MKLFKLIFGAFALFAATVVWCVLRLLTIIRYCVSFVYGLVRTLVRRIPLAFIGVVVLTVAWTAIMFYGATA